MLFFVAMLTYTRARFIPEEDAPTPAPVKPFNFDFDFKAIWELYGITTTTTPAPAFWPEDWDLEEENNKEEGSDYYPEPADKTADHGNQTPGDIIVSFIETLPGKLNTTFTLNFALILYDICLAVFYDFYFST